MATEDTTQSPGNGRVAAVTLPLSWGNNPALWLAQIEAKFALWPEVQDIITTHVTAISFEGLKVHVNEAICSLQDYLSPAFLCPGRCRRPNTFTVFVLSSTSSWS